MNELFKILGIKMPEIVKFTRKMHDQEQLLLKVKWYKYYVIIYIIYI